MEGTLVGQVLRSDLKTIAKPTKSGLLNVWHVVVLSQTAQDLNLDVYIYLHGEPSQELLQNLPDSVLEDDKKFFKAKSSLVFPTASFRAEGNSLLELEE